MKRLTQLISVLPTADPPERGLKFLQLVAAAYLNGFDEGCIAFCRVDRQVGFFPSSLNFSNIKTIIRKVYSTPREHDWAFSIDSANPENLTCPLTKLDLRLHYSHGPLSRRTRFRPFVSTVLFRTLRYEPNCFRFDSLQSTWVLFLR